MNNILVTGAAGFIGMHACERLLARGDGVVGIDNLNAYYDVELKKARLSRLEAHPAFRFERMDVADRGAMASLFERDQPRAVLHLAAQAGVRHSLDQPHAYVDSNLVGFVNVLEGCRAASVRHLVYASSSSVYGGNTKLPFAEQDAVDHPISLYAATKRSNELMAHAYSHLFRIPATGLRFFTVYGPWGRPDMALFKFTRAILSGETIDVYGRGQMIRDFTYIDNVIQMNIRAMETENPEAVNQVYNTAYGERTTLNQLVAYLKEYLAEHDADIPNVEVIHGPNRAGDIPHSLANIDKAKTLLGYDPQFSMKQGLKEAVSWYWNNL